MSERPIRVLVVDDHEIVLAGLLQSCGDSVNSSVFAAFTVVRRPLTGCSKRTSLTLSNELPRNMDIGCPLGLKAFPG